MYELLNSKDEILCRTGVIEVVGMKTKEIKMAIYMRYQGFFGRGGGGWRVVRCKKSFYMLSLSLSTSIKQSSVIKCFNLLKLNENEFLKKQINIYIRAKHYIDIYPSINYGLLGHRDPPSF